MIFAVYILTVILFFLLAGGFPAEGDAQTIIFHTYAFLALLALLCVSLLYCCIKRRVSLRSIGFHLSHISVILILVGALVGSMVGKRYKFYLPTSGIDPTDQVITGEHKTLKLDFKISATDLRIHYYDPDYYNLYAPPEGTNDYTFVRQIKIPHKGPLVIDDDTQVEREILEQKDGEWRHVHELPDKFVIQSARTISKYEVKLNLVSDQGDTKTQELAVNHPVSFEKWRIYLENCDHQQQQWVYLIARKDPGRVLVMGGMLAMILGVGLLCFRKKTGGAPAATSVNTNE